MLNFPKTLHFGVALLLRIELFLHAKFLSRMSNIQLMKLHHFHDEKYSKDLK
jgi:hypothetical protein